MFVSLSLLNQINETIRFRCPFWLIIIIVFILIESHWNEEAHSSNKISLAQRLPFSVHFFRLASGKYEAPEARKENK